MNRFSSLFFVLLLSYNCTIFSISINLVSDTRSLNCSAFFFIIFVFIFWNIFHAKIFSRIFFNMTYGRFHLNFFSDIAFCEIGYQQNLTGVELSKRNLANSNCIFYLLAINFSSHFSSFAWVHLIWLYTYVFDFVYPILFIFLCSFAYLK